MNNLKQVMLALHNCHDANGEFPAAGTHSGDGKPLLSWRVQILPYLEQNELYKQFHLDEPWDSPNNKPLLDKMPDVFRSPTIDAATKTTNTSVVAIVGPHAFLDPAKPRKMRQITDGTSNTIAVVETKTDIPWTKPGDLEFDPAKELPKIEGLHSGGARGGFITGFADGSVRFVVVDVDQELLKKLMTIDGKEPVQLPQ